MTQIPRPSSLQNTPSAIFARMASRPIPRVTRMMHVARERGLRPLFAGAIRGEENERFSTWDGFSLVRLGQPFPLLNGRGVLTYLRGVVAYNRDLFQLLRKHRPEFVHASDIETLPACLAYRLNTRTAVLFNIHDNLADRYNIPMPFARLLNVVEGAAVVFAGRAIVPESFRRESLPRWCQSRVSVIRNTPKDQGATDPPPIANHPIRILYAGWLDWGRGLRGLLEIADRNSGIEVRVAGEGNPEVTEALRRSKAHFLGFLGHDEVIQETKRSHFVAAFYDPVRPINRAAAPNKLAEAFSAGRPVLLNTEVRLARSLEHHNCTVTVPYDRILDIADYVERLGNEPKKYAAMCRSARARYDEEYSWASTHETIDRLFDELGLPRNTAHRRK